jgi:hypothetical protein
LPVLIAKRHERESAQIIDLDILDKETHLRTSSIWTCSSLYSILVLVMYIVIVMNEIRQEYRHLLVYFGNVSALRLCHIL